MSKLLWVQFQDGTLTLGFPTVEAALQFLRQQSSNPAWLALWTIRTINPHAEWIALAETKERVVLHFQ